MNVSLPAELRSYIDEQVDGGGYGSTSEYVRELVRRDKNRQQLRNAILEGANSKSGPVANEQYFETLRDQVRSGF